MIKEEDMLITERMKRKIAGKIKSELKQKSGYDFDVIVLHYSTVTIHIGPYDKNGHHSKDLHSWMEQNTLLLSDIVERACNFQFSRHNDTWIIKRGVIHYYDTYEENGIEHNLDAFYAWDETSGTFEFAGDYDNEKRCFVDWNHGGDEGQYEFEKTLPDYAKNKPSHRTEWQFIEEYGK